MYFTAVRNAVLINTGKKGEDRDVNEKVLQFKLFTLFDKLKKSGARLHVYKIVYSHSLHQNHSKCSIIPKILSSVSVR